VSRKPLVKNKIRTKIRYGVMNVVENYYCKDAKTRPKVASAWVFYLRELSFLLF
jgi:hypothetical protein